MSFDPNWKLLLGLAVPVVFALFSHVLLIRLVRMWRHGWAGKILVVSCPLALVIILFPIAQTARTDAQRKRCIAALERISEAKRSWAALQKAETSITPQPSDLTPHLKQGRLPVCLAGGTYTLGAVNEPPRCSHAAKGHTLTPIR